MNVLQKLNDEATKNDNCTPSKIGCHIDGSLSSMNNYINKLGELSNDSEETADKTVAKPSYKEQLLKLLQEASGLTVGKEYYTVVQQPIYKPCHVCNGAKTFEWNGYTHSCSYCKGTGSELCNHHFVAKRCQLVDFIIPISGLTIKCNIPPYNEDTPIIWVKTVDEHFNDNIVHSQAIFKTMEEAQKEADENEAYYNCAE